MEQDIKLAIINGENSIQDGTIHYFYNYDPELYHSMIFFEYIKEHYHMDEFKDLDLDSANSMILFLREKGNIVFVNSTTYKNGIPDKHGKTGIFAMPDWMTERQKNSLKELNQRVQNYDSFQIWYDFTSHINCKNIFTQNRSQVKTIIQFYIDKYANIKMDQDSYGKKGKQL